MAHEKQAKTKTKVAIITGGSRGLGRNTALSLARHGVDSIITYRSNQAEANSAVAEIRALGGKAVALQLDTTDSASFDAFAGEVKRALKENWDRETFDYLVNNAGISAPGSIADMKEADFDALYNVHLKGVFFLTQKLLPLIKDGGRIVNLSSGLARVTAPNRIVYGSLKGAVEVMTRYMAAELGPRGIAVNVVAPGAIATDFSGGIVRDNPGVQQVIASHTALGRAGVPDDVGPMIASLLSEDFRWVSGQRIEVSGGMRL
jgi:NAD(P)-dependent dehydrogenase (short-subunit alcohol dehydrogenase family)